MQELMRPLYVITSVSKPKNQSIQKCRNCQGPLRTDMPWNMMRGFGPEALSKAPKPFPTAGTFHKQQCTCCRGSPEKECTPNATALITEKLSTIVSTTRQKKTTRSLFRRETLFCDLTLASRSKTRANCHLVFKSHRNLHSYGIECVHVSLI